MTRNQVASRAAILLDLDGTLVDTAPDIVQAANRMLSELGAVALPFHTIKGFIGRGVPHLVRRSLEASGMAEAVDEEVAQRRFHKHYQAINGDLAAVFPGVREGLAALHTDGYRMACVTNKPFDLSTHLLAATGLAHYFEFIVGGDSTPLMKPSPEPLLHACRILGARPSQCWMVGDSEVDVAAARGASMPICVVDYGYCGPEGPEALPADRLIASFEQLPMIIQIPV